MILALEKVEQILARVQLFDQDQELENKRRMQDRQIVLWHDVLNNSLSRHPSGLHPQPLNGIQLPTSVEVQCHNHCVCSPPCGPGYN